MNEGPSFPPPLPVEAGGRPFLRRILETVRLFTLEPQTAYRRVTDSPSFGRPLAYGLAVGWVGAAAGMLWALAFQSTLLALLQQITGRDELGDLRNIQLLFGGLWLVLSPGFVFVSIFVMAAVYHLFLMLVSGAERGFGVTLKVVCYAQTAQLAQLVPFAGGILSLIWAIALAIIGLSSAHGTSAGKAALAVLLPLVLACCCAFAALALMVSLAVGGLAR